MTSVDLAEPSLVRAATSVPLWKRAVDVVAASVLLLLLLPLMLVLAAAVKITSHGPVFYRQERYGLNGRRFEMIKFRTMHVDADEQLQQDDALQELLRAGGKPAEDSRVTTLGRDMRLLSLDELPQLWNVIRGEMSLIGPRPLRYRFELDWYEDGVDELLSVRPGMTGLWQVSGRSNVSHRQRVQLDLEYVRSMAPSNDLSILLRTIRVVLFPRDNGAY
ncbi:MAG: sugar transferase [Nitriliruptorales bacterium]|nr:sugar transferase [Nitriliruptorales bacterium]